MVVVHSVPQKFPTFTCLSKPKWEIFYGHSVVVVVVCDISLSKGGSTSTPLLSKMGVCDISQ